jgi:LCP family protein required for cell wall assembly
MGRALSLTLLATAAPALLLGLVGFVLVATQRPLLLRLAVDPTWLALLAGGLVVAWLLWLALIGTTYARNRPLYAQGVTGLAGTVVVVGLCLAVTAPMLLGARYALVQHGLITTVFDDERSATAPTATREDPWGGRDRVNVLLLGGDGKVGRPGVRTDSMILTSIDVHTGQAVMFSLPRNLRNVPFPPDSPLAEVYPDGFTGDGDIAEYFLNAVYGNVPALHPGVLGRSDNEGADAVKEAVSGALGLEVDYYVLVNLAGFEQIVDAIGGITVNINEPVAIGGNTDLGIPPDGYLEPGPDQRLDGFHALWFSRGRWGSSDYQRMQRQRCALNAIVEEADAATMLRRYTALAEAGKKLLRTDIPQDLLPAFVDLATRMKDRSLESVGFERTDAFDPNDPDYDYVQRTVQVALAPPARPDRPGKSPKQPTPSQQPSEAPTEVPVDDAEEQVQAGRPTLAEVDCGYHADETDTAAVPTAD